MHRRDFVRYGTGALIAAGLPVPGGAAPPVAAMIELKPFSHVVIFWTDPTKPAAANELIAGAKRYLASIPGVVHFHIGTMVPSHRSVVDQTYQVGLAIQFKSKQAQDDYQVHPLHVEFIEHAFKPNCTRVVVYDFQ